MFYFIEKQRFLADSVEQSGEDFSGRTSSDFNEQEELGEKCRNVLAYYAPGHNVEMMRSSNNCKLVTHHCTFPVNGNDKEVPRTN